MTLQSIGHDAFLIAEQHGFHNKIEREGQKISVTTAEKLCLIHSEVSEALEAYRKEDWDNFAEELADVIIRTAELAYGLALDLDYAVELKMATNKQRDFRHGGKIL